MKRYLIILLSFICLVAVLKARTAFCFVLTQDLKDDLDDKAWLVKVHPNDAQSHFELAITEAYSNKIEDGLNELKKVNQLDPNFAPKAMKIYAKKVRLYPNDWKIRFRYAFSLYFNGKKKEAIAEFEKIIKQDPKNIFSYGYIATIYGEMNEVSKAIDYSKKALEIDSNVAAIHLLLGTAYYKNNQAAMGFQETFEALRLRALGY